MRVDWVWRIGLSIALIIGVLIVATAVAAQSVIVVPLDTVVRGPDGYTELVAGPIPAPALGLECVAELTKTANNESDHPNTNILIQSGSSETGFFDVEQPGFTGAGIGGFILDGPINVFVQVGADEVASMGFELVLRCVFPPVVDPPPPLDEETTTTTTTQPPTTTLSPPPVGAPETGGGACADGCEGGMGWLAWTFIGFGVLFLLLALIFIGALVRARGAADQRALDGWDSDGWSGQ